jgi:hypothetical protein
MVKVSLVTIKKCSKLNVFTLATPLVKAMVRNRVSVSTRLEQPSGDLARPGAADAKATQASPPRWSCHRDDGGVRVVHCED